ncbi:hypothetical protein GGP88_003378 [Salinibacter ruber]|nr:hypothetical protein [Salinibacter ruber]
MLCLDLPTQPATEIDQAKSCRVDSLVQLLEEAYVDPLRSVQRLVPAPLITDRKA